jgi:cysteinyl-tRNA synthetase
MKAIVPKTIRLYNSLSGQKEVFKPVHEGRVGLYVCGPTVYSDAHLGNCRTFVNFDIIYRFFEYCGYKVRYVRNITDVGHLVGDVDHSDADDKIAKKARAEQVEPMEIVQKYTNGFHDVMRHLNTLSPSIEPRATGHILEQIEMIQSILKNGWAYIKNGSVYFDTLKYANADKGYGQLSGRILDDLLVETRDLKNQDEKKHPSDFALWMKAAPKHLMHWNSPWSVGFPGWHLECSAMSTKYLGKTFDIHGGGNDLKFPHHENEIAQNVGACGCQPAKYWLHANMLLLYGKKMSKSDGYYVAPNELFAGTCELKDEHGNKILTKPYSPMTVRFFILQAHYRSTMDLTDSGLQAAEKGWKYLMETYKSLKLMVAPKGAKPLLDKQLDELANAAFEDMSDDFNCPKAMSRLFELGSKINALKGGQLSMKEVSEDCLRRIEHVFHDFMFKIFGLRDESADAASTHATMDGLMQLIIEMRQQARTNKDWTTSDKIRNTLQAVGIDLRDGKEGTTWVKN